MKPTMEEIEKGGELVKSCYQTADKLLTENNIDPFLETQITVSVPELRVMLAKASAYGYGHGMTDTKYIATANFQQAAVEHGRTVKVVTADGEKLTPRAKGFWGWVRSAFL